MKKQKYIFEEKTPTYGSHIFYNLLVVTICRELCFLSNDAFSKKNIGVIYYAP
jgi:hypothetical protein